MPAFFSLLFLLARVRSVCRTSVCIACGEGMEGEVRNADAVSGDTSEDERKVTARSWVRPPRARGPAPAPARTRRSYVREQGCEYTCAVPSPSQHTYAHAHAPLGTIAIDTATGECADRVNAAASRPRARQRCAVLVHGRTLVHVLARPRGRMPRVPPVHWGQRLPLPSPAAPMPIVHTYAPQSPQPAGPGAVQVRHATSQRAQTRLGPVR
jgi:hypothetical protein